MAATAQIIDGASAISAAKLQAFLSLGSLLTFIVLVITNLIDYRPFYTISNPISVHDIHPLYISMFFLGWLFVYGACGANDIMMRYPAYFPDKLEVAAAGVRFITPYLTTLSIFWKLPIGWLSTYIAALERFLEMQVPWLLDKESLKYAFGGICLLIVFKVVVWLLIFYCTAPLVIFWHDLIITAIERGPSNAVELIKPTVRRQWTDSRLAANNQWRCTKLAATARLQSLKTSVKQFLRLCKPLVTFTRPTAMTEPALEEVHARLQSRNLDHHAQDNVHAALREAQDDLDGAAQEVEMLREDNDRLRRDINRVEASEARAYGARLKVDKEVERHEREIEMLNERHRQDSEDVDRLQKQIWEKDADLARIRRERDQAREKLAIRERDLREKKRASMSGRRK